jgi:aromatic-L-amino-acid decarboxylase
MSDQAHSSIEKAIKITGIGKNNIRLIKTNESLEMIAEEFEKQIKEDIKNGFSPLHVTIAVGTTGSVAVDPLNEIALIANKYNIWAHVDAAYAGTAMLCEEFRWMIKGIENIDSYVFNAHKWMLTNFDCSLYFVKDKGALIRTFEILPEYLKTKEGDSVNNYRDWGIQLGRRFRALKLWFVIRHYGVKGLQEFIRRQISITKKLIETINTHKDFEITTPVHLNVICFRMLKGNSLEAQNINNEMLLDRLNKTGKYFFSHTKLADKYVIRFCIAQTNVSDAHVTQAWKDIVNYSNEI